MLPRITNPPSGSRTTSGAGGFPSFPLSPTIPSTKSSTVAIPATVPCSSITTANGCPFWRISRNNSEPIFVSGMKSTGLTSSRTLRFSKSWSAICRRSCEYTTPKISSSDFSYTAILFNFVSTTLACNSSSVASACSATISGRGVITSRTRLSLNSTTCSIKSACSGSMMPSSSAASTSASIPSSVRCSSVFSTSCSEIRASDSAPSRNTRTGQTNHIAPRISGKNGSSQRPVVRYSSMAGRWLLPLLPLIRGAMWFVWPVREFLEGAESLARISEYEAEKTEEQRTEEGIEALVEAAEEEGIIEPEQADLIEQVVEFSDKRVREVMTPRPEVVAIAAGATLEELHAKLLESGFSKLPVYENSLDDIHGVVYSQDLLQVADTDLQKRVVRELMRPVLFMPETKVGSELLREMRQRD